MPEIYQDMIEAYYVEQVIKNKDKMSGDFVQSVVDDLATLYTAGTATTSRNLLMAIYYVFKNQSVKERLREDIQKYMGKSEGLTYDNIKKSTYLEAVMLETERIYSSANGIFFREAVRDHYLMVGDDKYLIKKGTLVNPQNLTVQYNKDLYPDP